MKKTGINLIPDTVNPTPDYYCTWQTQLYATCDGKPQGQRAIIGEKALFDTEKPYGWAYFYEQVRKDLFLVMDDSWDVPGGEDLSYCGSLVLDKGKFPSFTEGASSNVEAMRKLSDKIKSLGWKGLGGWICAQESPHFIGDDPQETYWKKRLIEAKEAGIAYWKVDWGEWFLLADFRRMLTELGRKYAPELVIEHAKVAEVLPCCDVFRTYDVPAIMSIPMTISKVADFASAEAPRSGNMCLLNCEDEAYIAAAGGFAMGIMRHPYNGDFVNGKADMSFPKIHRNLKTKMYEVIRGVRWHKIAPAYAFDSQNLSISKTQLCDTWTFEKIEEEIEDFWLEAHVFDDNMQDNTLSMQAPSCISRNTELPTADPDENGYVPFIVASHNPNGAFSVAALGRTIGRDYSIPKCDVTVDVKDSKTLGVFGEYKNLIVKVSSTDVKRVLMQDLAGDEAFDITDAVAIEPGRIIIPGDIISKIGTLAQPEEDTSEPGVVIQFS